jgi:hypothetical protein
MELETLGQAFFIGLHVGTCGDGESTKAEDQARQEE